MKENKESIQSKILGTWKLVRYTMTPENSNDFFFPFGENALGYLTYTPQKVSVHVMRAERVKKSDPTERSLEAAENYAGYIGRYEVVNSEQITHYPEVSSWVDYINVAEVRFFKIQGNQLILTCDSFHKGRGCQVRSELIWQRSS
jgi:hypothetical protein